MDTATATPPVQAPNVQMDREAYISHWKSLGVQDPVVPKEMMEAPPAAAEVKTEPAAAVETPAAPATPATTEAAKVEDAKAEEPKKEEPTKEPTKFSSFIKPPEGPKPLTDEQKAILKERGIEDLDAFQTQYKTIGEELQILKKEHEAAKQVVDTISKLDPVYQEFLRVAAKGEDALAWARKQPHVDLTKEASKLSKLELVEKYCPDAFTKEEWDVLKNPDDALEEEVAALKKRVEPWAKVATPMHEEARKAIIASRENEQVTQKQIAEKISNSVAANTAYLKERHPELYSDLSQQDIADFNSGKMFNDMFFEQDGIVPKPSALSDLKTLKNLPGILQAVREAALEEGRTEATLRSAMRGPTTPPGGAPVNGADQPLTEEQKRYLQHLNDLKPKEFGYTVRTN